MEQHALVGVVVVLLGHLLPAVAVSLPQLLVAHLLDLERRQTERSEVIAPASAEVLMPTGTHAAYLHQCVSVEDSPSVAAVAVLSDCALHLNDTKEVLFHSRASRLPWPRRRRRA